MEQFYYTLKGEGTSLQLGEFEHLRDAVEYAQAEFKDKLKEVFGKECVWQADSEQIFLRATEQ